MKPSDINGCRPVTPLRPLQESNPGQARLVFLSLSVHQGSLLSVIGIRIFLVIYTDAFRARNRRMLAVLNLCLVALTGVYRLIGAGFTRRRRDYLIVCFSKFDG